MGEEIERTRHKKKNSPKRETKTLGFFARAQTVYFFHEGGTLCGVNGGKKTMSTKGGSQGVQLQIQKKLESPRGGRNGTLWGGSELQTGFGEGPNGGGTKKSHHEGKPRARTMTRVKGKKRGGGKKGKKRKRGLATKGKDTKGRKGKKDLWIPLGKEKRIAKGRG